MTAAWIVQGDARRLPLVTGSVQCVITSPPYFGLRSYGGQVSVWGGDPNCTHSLTDSPARRPMAGGTGSASAKQVTNTGSQFGNAWAETIRTVDNNNGNASTTAKVQFNGESRYARLAVATCTLCGAWRGELGSEPTPAAFVAHLVEVFAEVWRVLRDDGVCFVNLGDSMAGSGKGPTGHNGLGNHERRQGFVGGADSGVRPYGNAGKVRSGSLDRDSSSSNLCGGCRVVAKAGRHTSRNDSQPAPESTACEVAPNQEHNLLGCPSLGSSDFSHQTPIGQSCLATPDPSPEPAPLGAVALDAPVSTTPESSLLPQEECSHCDNCDACLSVLASSSRDSRACARRKVSPSSARLSAGGTQGRGGNISGNGETVDSLGRRIPDTGVGSSSWGYSNTPARHKSLLLVPERFAIAMSDYGWIVRQVLIWSKPNPMPESVRDRWTSSHEYILMLVKQGRYYFDQAGIAEPSISDHDSGNGYARPERLSIDGRDGNGHAGQSGPWTRAAHLTRNGRSVWVIPTAQYKAAHYAVFNEEIPRRCILAATSDYGACAACGAPWRRVVKKSPNPYPGSSHDHTADLIGPGAQRHASGVPSETIMAKRWLEREPSQQTGWTPSCKCGPDAGVRPCVVLDPFSGSGTVAYQAARMGRRGIGVELSWEYLEQTRSGRLRQNFLPLEAAR